MENICLLQGIDNIYYETEYRREWCTSKGKPSRCFLFARKFTRPAALRLLNMVSFMSSFFTNFHGTKMLEEPFWQPIRLSLFPLLASNPSNNKQSLFIFYILTVFARSEASLIFVKASISRSRNTLQAYKKITNSGPVLAVARNNFSI